MENNPFIAHMCLTLFAFGFFVGMAVRLFIDNLKND